MISYVLGLLPIVHQEIRQTSHCFQGEEKLNVLHESNNSTNAKAGTI